MKANYVQRGGSLDYKNTTGNMIAAGDVLILGARIGVAGTDMVPGGIGTVHVDGVYEIAKKDSIAVTAGTEVYLAEDGITTASENNVRAGFAAMDSGQESDRVCVKINA